jgi:sulfite exporter TauE/SafE
VGGFVEALALGFGSGPVCLASCGPVLLPWLGAEPRELRATGRLLALFLGGRLAGYLAFAVVAWAAGLALPVDARTRTLVFGLANFGLAGLLGISACLPRRHCGMASDEPQARLYQIGPADRFRPPAALTLGFLTGLNLCPPFVTAGVRAAATHSLLGALAFFTVFFVGTSIWFLPSLAVSPLRRFRVVPTVARMTMGALALYYTYLGIVAAASWRLIPGRASSLFISVNWMVSHA